MYPGTIVSFRRREWVLLPSDTDSIIRLRPITGSQDETIEVQRYLTQYLRYTFPFEEIKPASFPLPSVGDVADVFSAKLLWNAARLSLREGATPFRSMGRINIRPRLYQFVPLLMALRLNPVRILIADDVGVGKTIEALLIVKELLERGEIKRVAVLCPPYLCEQWQRELYEKFSLDSVIIRSSTVSQLERTKPSGMSIYQYYPLQILSIDWVKTERNRHQFLQFCPEMVVVDEVHGASDPSPQRIEQQQRYQLVKEISEDPNRHLILLTATPHSGKREAFASILGFLDPKFANWDMANLSEEKRTELARHFVQRTRADIQTQWEVTPCFPKRVSEDRTYTLSPAYREVFDRSYRLFTTILKAGEGLDENRRRVRNWGALWLLRSIMSSPASARAAIEKKRGKLKDEDVEELIEELPIESSEPDASDEVNATGVGLLAERVADQEKRLLKEVLALIEDLDPKEDWKLIECIKTVKLLLSQGRCPVVWCYYVDTAIYVAEALKEALPSEVQVLCITGRISDEERKARIEDLDINYPRVLVATDCLSEGINLQESFDSVFHYDLPWNPNRLEQREGRVDRYGQVAPEVKVIRFFGRDNPIDGAVLKVLIRN